MSIKPAELLTLQDMKVKKSIIPLGTMVETFLPADYMDAYMGRVNKNHSFTPEDIMVRIWTDFSIGVRVLFTIRNFFVKIARLKTPRKENLEGVEDCIRKGIDFDFLSRVARSKDEVVVLLTDKHLDAYLGIYIESNKGYREVYMITVVHFHNQVGRIYFWIIRPFHKVVVKSMLKRALSKYTD